MTFLGKRLVLVLLIGHVFDHIIGFCTENPAPEKLTIYLVGNAHIDLAYRWRWNETVDRVGPDTFEGVLQMMDKEPGLTFAQSQLALYQEIQKNNPVLFTRIKEKINSGDWSVVGGQWAEPDAILPSGESLIRQFLIGMEYSRKHLGIDSVAIAWVPDSFCGQALTLPQIYNGCGINYYVFGRGAPRDKRIFWWESPDGTRLLAYNAPLGYGLRNPNESILPRLQEWFNIAGVTEAMLLYGEGDHGGGPRDPDVQAIHQLQKVKNFPKLVYDTPEAYFARLSAIKKDWPVHRGEIGMGTGEGGDVAGSWYGSYTSQARTKKRNRDCENLLVTAEKFATIGAMLQRKPLYPRVDFREAWKLVLRNQFHDILPGTSIGEVFDDTMTDYDNVEQEGNRLLRSGLEVIGSRIDTRGEGIPLVVYNPNSWPRTDVVDAQIRFTVKPARFTTKDYSGTAIPCQIHQWSDDSLVVQVAFLAENVPASGYKLYRVFLDRSSVVDTDLKISTNSAETAFFIVKWDDDGVTSIYDKQLQKEILNGRGNICQLLGESRSSSWDLVLSGEEINLARVKSSRIMENGPVRLVVSWQEKSESSLFTRKLILSAGVPVIKFTMMVNWYDHDRLLKLTFPTRVQNGRAFFEQPYGVIERATDGMECPAQNWIDLANDEFGIALLNDGKYGFDINNNVMRMSVVRGARDMDPRMDQGVHTFSYALYPHAGDWRSGNVTQKALELNQPLIVLQENLHIGNLPDWGSYRINEFSLPPEQSFFGIASDHVIISAIKVQQGDWSPAHTVLRIFETEGRDDMVTVNLPATPTTVVETNHIEDVITRKSDIKIDNNSFSFKIGHHQIRTFLLNF